MVSGFDLKVSPAWLLTSKNFWMTFKKVPKWPIFCNNHVVQVIVTQTWFIYQSIFPSQVLNFSNKLSTNIPNWFYIFARLPLYTCLFWQPHHVLFLLFLSFPWILFLFTQCGHHFDINYNGKTIPHHSLATTIPRNFVITKKLKRRVWYFFGDNRGSLSKGSCLTVQSVSYNPIMTAITGFRLSSVNNINLGLYEGVAISCAGDNEMFANELTNNSFNQDRVKSRALFH